MAKKCDRDKLAAKIRETRKEKPSRDLIPLHTHLIKLAIDSAKRGYCQRAGRELAHARKLARKFPGK